MLPGRDPAAPSSQSGPTRMRARTAAGLRRSSRHPGQHGPRAASLTARPRGRAAATRARRCRRGSRDRAPARPTETHGRHAGIHQRLHRERQLELSPRRERQPCHHGSQRGGTTQLFMLTYTSSPNAVSIAASGFSMTRSSHPSRAMTTANFWMRSGEIRPSASRPARLNAATAGAPCSTSARHDADGIEVVPVHDEHGVLADECAGREHRIRRPTRRRLDCELERRDGASASARSSRARPGATGPMTMHAREMPLSARLWSR